MGDAAPKTEMSLEAYFELAERSLERVEFINGEAYAMSGGSPAHAAIGMNVGATLHAKLRGKPCRPTSGDQRIHVATTGSYLYPDITVVCGQFEYADSDPSALTNPKVIFEVLSPSTADFDRGAKFDHYRRIESLAAYIVIHQGQRRVERRTRLEDGDWLLSEFETGEVAIESLGIALSLDEIYDLEGVI